VINFSTLGLPVSRFHTFVCYLRCCKYLNKVIDLISTVIIARPVNSENIVTAFIYVSENKQIISNQNTKKWQPRQPKSVAIIAANIWQRNYTGTNERDLILSCIIPWLRREVKSFVFNNSVRHFLQRVSKIFSGANKQPSNFWYLIWMSFHGAVCDRLRVATNLRQLNARNSS